MAKKDVFAPVDTDHPDFRSWFGKSVLHDEGVPRTYYHGTSKDVDFKKFKMSRHGIWMTTDPEYASEYAVQNDSQGFRAEGWSMKPTNTASRVIPVHARIEKPFVGEMPQEVLGKENYKKAQSEWFDALRAQGYDGWVPKSKNGNLAVALGHPGQIKSALSNTGNYSETGDINKAEGGSVDDKGVGWSASRINRELNWSHYDDGRAKAHVAFVNPSDFVNATTKNKQTANSISKDAGDLDEDKLSANDQSPFLKVRDGKIVDHEGRHRMAALAAAGHKRVPVMVWHDRADRLQPTDRIDLKAQHPNRPGLSVFDAVPLHKSHKGGIESAMKGSSMRFADGGSVDSFIPHDDPQRQENLQNWFGYSHVVDERGNPMVLYHGTDADFDEFDPNKIGQTDHGWYGEGHYLTASPELASAYSGYKNNKAIVGEEIHPGQNVMPVYARLENPYYWPEGRAAATSKEEAKNITEELRKQGYDGVIAPNKHADMPEGKFWEVVVFTPHQIKSATGNSGHFNMQSPKLNKADGGSVDGQPQRDLSPLGLYSHAAEMASKLPQERGAPQQMLGMLANKYAVKPVELDSAQKAFAGRPQVTRDELVQHFRENAPQIEETLLGGPNSEQGVRDRWIDNHAAQIAVWAKDIKSPEEFASLPANKRRWHQMSAEEVFDQKIREEPEFRKELRASIGPDTRYEDEQLPGGSNYREILLRAPSVSPETAAAGKLLDKIEREYGDFYSAPQELRDQYEQLSARSMRGFDKPVYTSNHWDEPNVLAHVRLSDRTGPNGEKMLHVEEIQSDWAQEGRDKGFQGDAKAKYDDFLEDMRVRARQDIGQIAKESNIPPEIEKKLVANVDGMQPHQLAKYLGEDDKLRAAYQDYTESLKRVIDHPYVTTTPAWTDLALKRILKEAADGGYARIVITPGADQADRYSLATRVHRVAYDPEEKTLSFVPKDGNGWKDYGGDVEPHELPGIIGKEIADRLLASEPNKLSGNHSLEGDDLKVGGHGMIGFYDKIVPSQLAKMVKKMDPEARIGQSMISGHDRPLHALDVTPKIKAAVQRGLPFYASGGAVEDDEDEGLTAYHGSPYDFERFDISKIGTGEGAQAYGHGLYFAESEPIAKEYRDRLTDKTSNFRVGDIDMPKWILRSIEGAEDRNAAIEQHRQDFSNRLAEAEAEKETSHQPWMVSGRISTAKDILSGLDQLQQGTPAPHTKGRMYEVRIKANPEHFLDWDEGLEDQSDYIKNALRRVADHDEAQKGYTDLHEHLNDPDAYAGGAFYQTLADRGRGKEASEILHKMGIKGIRYKDAASRVNQANPTYNYVVFDHDLVKVKRKYARGGSVAHA